MQDLISIYQQHQGIFDAIFTILSVTGILGGIKKVIAKELSTKTLTVLLTVLSTAGAFLQWFLSNFSQSDAAFGIYTGAIIGFTHLFYNFVVKPTTNLAKDVQVEKQNQAASSQATATGSASQAVNTLVNPIVVDA